MSALALSRLKRTWPLVESGVSGELRYFAMGRPFSSVSSRARAVKAMSLALLVGDGEGDALAEAGVELALEPSALLFALKRPAGAEDFFGEVFSELLAHVVEVVGGVADAELRDGVGVDAAAGEVLAGAGGFGGL